MLAQSIVDRCEFIGSGRVAVVIGLLYELQAHVIDNGLSEVGGAARPACICASGAVRYRLALCRDPLQAFAPPTKASSSKPPKAPARQVRAPVFQCVTHAGASQAPLIMLVRCAEPHQRKFVPARQHWRR